jgi:hypothetical protein
MIWVEAFMTLIITSSRIIKVFLPIFFCCLPALFLILGCLGSASIWEAGFTPGIYEGIGNGHRGPIRVRVQISAAGIEDIVIVSHREAAFPGIAAMEELLEEVLEIGSTDLDSISGATFSSRGFLEAVENALRKALLQE